MMPYKSLKRYISWFDWVCDILWSTKMLRNGAREWNRTITVFLPGDFKSPASTNFATRALLMPLSSWDSQILRQSSLEHKCALATLSLSLPASLWKRLSKVPLVVICFHEVSIYCVETCSSTGVHSQVISLSLLTSWNHKPSKKILFDASILVRSSIVKSKLAQALACIRKLSSCFCQLYETINLANLFSFASLAKCFILVKNLKL